MRSSTAKCLHASATNVLARTTISRSSSLTNPVLKFTGSKCTQISTIPNLALARSVDRSTPRKADTRPRIKIRGRAFDGYATGVEAASALQRKIYYFPRLLPASLSLRLGGLGRTPLLVWGLVAEPVVVPGFMLDLVASAPALPSLEAPGAGCVCADAIAIAPNSAATTRAEIASLDRMAISSLDYYEGVRTCHANLGSRRALFWRENNVFAKNHLPSDQLRGFAFAEDALCEGRLRPSTRTDTTYCRCSWRRYRLCWNANSFRCSCRTSSCCALHCRISFWNG